MVRLGRLRRRRDSVSWGWYAMRNRKGKEGKLERSEDCRSTWELCAKRSMLVPMSFYVEVVAGMYDSDH